MRWLVLAAVLAGCSIETDPGDPTYPLPPEERMGSACESTADMPRCLVLRDGVWQEWPYPNHVAICLRDGVLADGYTPACAMDFGGTEVHWYCVDAAGEPDYSGDLSVTCGDPALYAP